MAVNFTYWLGENGYDIHVVAGTTSPSLLPALAINHGTPAVNVAATGPLPAGVTVAFQAAFNGALVGGGPNFAGFGVTVDQNTGAVTVANPIPGPPFLRNFLIRAVVTDPAIAPPFVKKVRVHIHNAVTRIWLTPNPLSIRRGADGQRFSVLAEFDDQTVGDVSRLPALVWSSGGAEVSVDAATGGLTATQDITAFVPITVTLPAAWGGASATATCNTLPAWSPPDRNVKLIAGSAGAARMADVVNFVFVGEGFQVGEEPMFEQRAQAFATFLRTSSAAQPYGICSGEINYWMLSLESPDRGSSPLYEIAPVTRGAKTFGREVPQPVDPQAAAAIWTTAQAIHEIGLPVHAHVGVAFNVQQAEWTALFGAGVAAHVNAALHTEWLTYAERRLVNETDTALGLRCGERPRVEQSSPPRAGGWHPFRTTRAQFEQMLVNLRDAAAPGGPAIGAVWGPGGKDRILVAALCAGARNAGGRTLPPNDLIATTFVVNSEVELAPVAGTRGFTLVPYAVPVDAPLDSQCTVAHESAHALGLGDEYGSAGSLPASRVADVAARLNLQDVASVAVPPPALDPTRLKWTWPRITKAGVLTGPLTLQGAEFRIPLRPGHERPFAVGDKVKLRERPLTAAVIPSIELEVTVVDAATHQIQVKAGGVFVPVTWGAGSIVFAEKHAPGAGGAVLGLISPTVLAHITANGIPLNVAPVAPAAHVCAADGRTVQPALSRPAALPAGKPKWSAWIVGAFEGGLTYGCGILHPTGACMMRQLLLPEGAAQAEFKVKEVAYRFCPVCRYALVDRIDPTQHGRNDAWYDSRYAEP
ncbi:MAG TPA: hypothetical protein VGQ44_20220 [Gemmatimonadaceae bacterium]|jgi:hypothetical protein|nr:hypothetical protein [Gemmatimonadaceae bacterium]